MPGSQNSDPIATLLTQVQAEEPGSWDVFVKRYERLVWSVPLRMGFSQADAADITQITWSLIWRHIKHVKHPAGLTSWLITTASREAARWGRKERLREDREAQRQADSDASDFQLPPDESERLEQIQAVRDAIADLDPKCSNLLRETDLEGNSYKEAAQALKMPIGSIGPTRLRCLAKLMGELRARGLS